MIIQTSCLLDYNYLKNYFKIKILSIDLSKKQQALNSDPKTKKKLID